MSDAKVKARALAFAKATVAAQRVTKPRLRSWQPGTATVRFSPHGWTPRPVTPGVAGHPPTPRPLAGVATPPPPEFQPATAIRRSLSPYAWLPPQTLPSPLSMPTPADISPWDLAMRRIQQGGRYVSQLAGRYPRTLATGAGLIGAHMAGLPVAAMARTAYDYMPSFFDAPAQAGAQIGQALAEHLAVPAAAVAHHFAAPAAAAVQYIPAVAAPAVHFATRAAAQLAGHGPAAIKYMISQGMIG